MSSLFVFKLQFATEEEPLFLYVSLLLGFTPPQMALVKEEAVTTLLYRDNAFPEESISFRR